MSSSLQNLIVRIVGLASLAYIIAWLLGFPVAFAHVPLGIFGVALWAWTEFREWQKRKRR